MDITTGPLEVWDVGNRGLLSFPAIIEKGESSCVIVQCNSRVLRNGAIGRGSASRVGLQDAIPCQTL